MKLSPRDPILWLWEFYICDLHTNLAQWDQAIAPCQQALTANPKLSFAHFELAAAYGWLGRVTEAKAELAEALKASPGATVKGSIAYASTLSDNPVFLQQAARRVEGFRRAGMPEQ